MTERIPLDAPLEHGHRHQPLNLDYDDSGDLVPGWFDSPDYAADAADQARQDRQEARRNG